MHLTLKLDDTFNFSHCIGVYADTLHVEDYMYMFNSDHIFPSSLQLVLMIIKTYVMADLCYWTKVQFLNKTFYERYLKSNGSSSFKVE